MKTKMEEFMDGQGDCKEGKVPDKERGKDYHRGYAAQYALEQIKTENDLLKERIHGLRLIK